MSPLLQQVTAELARGQAKTAWMSALKGPWNSPEIKKIEEVCAVLWERKGKKLRSQWVFWFGEALGFQSTELNLYAWAVEAIHTATLLHDDVIDKAPLRRGGASANALYDNTLPVLSGDYLLSDAIYQLAEQGHPFLMKLMCQAVKEVTQGEVLQYEQKYRIPSDTGYFRQLNRLKTSALLNWSAQVGAVLSCGKEDPRITDLASHYGSLYQFTDDLLDVRGTSTKESWQDLKEGKINEATFLILQQSCELRIRTERELSLKNVSQELIDRFRELIKTPSCHGILEKELFRRKKECLESLEGLSNSQLIRTMDSLIRFTVERLF